MGESNSNRFCLELKQGRKIEFGLMTKSAQHAIIKSFSNKRYFTKEYNV